jgi:hypothetical protein
MVAGRTIPDREAGGAADTTPGASCPGASNSVSSVAVTRRFRDAEDAFEINEYAIFCNRKQSMKTPQKSLVGNGELLWRELQHGAIITAVVIIAPPIRPFTRKN